MAERRFALINHRHSPTRATTAELVDISNVVNTSSDKEHGFRVFNTTTSIPVYALGDADGDVWTDSTGVTVHTPV